MCIWARPYTSGNKLEMSRGNDTASTVKLKSTTTRQALWAVTDLFIVLMP